MNLQQKDLFFC